MTNREILTTIKHFSLLRSQIDFVAKEIIKDTFDCNIRYVVTILVLDTEVVVSYESLRGNPCSYYSSEKVRIPIEWFDEGFDYKSAYREILRAEEEERMKAEAEENLRQKKLQEEEDALYILS